MKFVDVPVGSQFKYQNQVCAKISPEKVSCCKTLNAVILETNTKIMVKPVDDVELVNSEAK